MPKTEHSGMRWAVCGGRRSPVQVWRARAHSLWACVWSSRQGLCGSAQTRQVGLPHRSVLVGQEGQEGMESQERAQGNPAGGGAEPEDSRGSQAQSWLGVSLLPCVKTLKQIAGPVLKM